MKKLILLLAIVVSFFSCEKDSRHVFEKGAIPKLSLDPTKDQSVDPTKVRDFNAGLNYEIITDKEVSKVDFGVAVKGTKLDKDVALTSSTEKRGQINLNYDLIQKAIGFKDEEVTGATKFTFYVDKITLADNSVVTFKDIEKLPVKQTLIGSQKQDSIVDTILNITTQSADLKGSNPKVYGFAAEMFAVCPDIYIKEGTYTVTFKGTIGQGLGQSNPLEKTIKGSKITKQDLFFAFNMTNVLGHSTFTAYAAFGAAPVNGVMFEVCGELLPQGISDGWGPIKVSDFKTLGDGAFSYKSQGTFGDNGTVTYTPEK